NSEFHEFRALLRQMLMLGDHHLVAATPNTNCNHGRENQQEFCRKRGNMVPDDKSRLHFGSAGATNQSVANLAERYYD
ncbi:MAG TPA: hypothetical protein P5307_22435, partial [Pirellulaceae bacterium]|nr:hypothetical protein [Pirellulaceae bacterium]